MKKIKSERKNDEDDYWEKQRLKQEYGKEK